MKFRVIVNGIHFFTTTKAIRNGVGDSYATNAALQKALICLETPVTRNYFAPMPKVSPNGIAGVWEGMSVQLDRV